MVIDGFTPFRNINETDSFFFQSCDYYPIISIQEGTDATKSRECIIIKVPSLVRLFEIYDHRLFLPYPENPALKRHEKKTGFNEVALRMLIHRAYVCDGVYFLNHNTYKYGWLGDRWDREAANALVDLKLCTSYRVL